ncbi:MAG: M23 family metallopeptidase [Oscillospiraceae bacterium]|nr:M23 family metallopeptidase [Oscillospiraceae bacterium]
MNQKQGKAHKLLDFFAGKGFYVVLILCVAAIGASGYMLFFGGSGEVPESPGLALASPGSPPAPRPPGVSIAPAAPPPPALPPSSPPPLAAPTPPVVEIPRQSGSVSDTPGAAAVSGEGDGEDVAVTGNAPLLPAVPPASPQPTPASDENTVPSFFPPVRGEVIVSFSEIADVFYETLREWRYHPGVDIETAAGALVQAAADGVIAEVMENGPRSMGATVVIEHSGGYRTIYANLSGTLTAEAGKTVKAGDTIGAVGATSIAEASLPPHLHFEILKDGEPVDPAEYLP